VVAVSSRGSGTELLLSFSHQACAKAVGSYHVLSSMSVPAIMSMLTGSPREVVPLPMTPPTPTSGGGGASGGEDKLWEQLQVWKVVRRSYMCGPQ
jgi:hypothetical protein